MKVRCITDKIEKLDKDKIYTPIDEDEEFYLINKTDYVNYWYGKENFEIVKENTMKISKWEELIDFKVKNRIITYCEGVIDIYAVNGRYMNGLSIDEYTIEELIGILKVIGLDIKFIEEPKLTKRDRLWLEVMELNLNHTIKIENQTQNIRISDHEISFTNDLFRNLEIGKKYTVGELLKLKVED